MTDTLFSRFGRTYATGDVLFREGEGGDVMFVIQTGSIRISKAVGGEAKVLAVLGPGEFLGEMAILNGKPRTATASAVEPSKCLVIEARTLEQMVSNNSEIAMRLIKKLAKRLDSADALVGILMHQDPKARVMLGLSRHAEAYGEVIEEGILIRVPLVDLAREVGVTEEVAGQVMDRLTKLRLVRERDGSIVVADVSRLRDFMEFLEMPQKFGGES